jgi:hypothetical protein
MMALDVVALSKGSPNCTMPTNDAAAFTKAS